MSVCVYICMHVYKHEYMYAYIVAYTHIIIRIHTEVHTLKLAVVQGALSRYFVLLEIGGSEKCDVTYFRVVPRYVTKCDRGREGVKLVKNSVTYIMEDMAFHFEWKARGWIEEPDEDYGL